MDINSYTFVFSFIATSVAAIQDNQPPIMRVFAVKALYG